MRDIRIDDINKLFKAPVVLNDTKISDCILGLKFHNIIIESFSYITYGDRFMINVIKNKCELIKITPNWLSNQVVSIKRTNYKFNDSYFYNNGIIETSECILNRYFDVDTYLKFYNNEKPYDNEKYFNLFIDFTMKYSRTLKKKILKLIYKYENDKSNKKYEMVFNFLIRVFSLRIRKTIYNTNGINLVDKTRLSRYEELYELTGLEKVLTTIENRRRNINHILKN